MHHAHDLADLPTRETIENRIFAHRNVRHTFVARWGHECVQRPGDVRGPTQTCVRGQQQGAATEAAAICVACKQMQGATLAGGGKRVRSWATTRSCAWRQQQGAAHVNGIWKLCIWVVAGGATCRQPQGVACTCGCRRPRLPTRFRSNDTKQIAHENAFLKPRILSIKNGCLGVGYIRTTFCHDHVDGCLVPNKHVNVTPSLRLYWRDDNGVI